jgi:hypothetical protein
MRASTSLPVLAAAALLAGGCATLPAPEVARGQEPATDVRRPADDRTEANDKKEDGKKDASGNDKKDKEKEEKADKKDEKKGPPKTLFQWAVGPEVKDPDEDEPKPITTDRPDFTEASSTVGLGRVQLEAGYTYTRDHFAGATRVDHSFPEALLRIGLFADWFELRLGQNYHSTRTAFGPPAERLSGPDDFYVGAKLGLAEQRAYLPELAVILQATLPTGARSLTTDRVLPGVNFCYGWDVVKELLDAGGVFRASGAVDGDRHSYVEFAQSFSLGYRVTKELRAYGEWYAFYPTSATGPGVASQHYFDTGLAYQVTPDFQLDVRAGWGLSKSADDFFAGAGFSVRY